MEKPKQRVDISHDIIDMDSCAWFHRTTQGRSEKIAKDGFKLPTEKDVFYQYTKGIYFLNDKHHPKARGYGNTSIQTCVKGKFFDVEGDSRQFWQFYEQFKFDGVNYDDQKAKIHEAYPELDGMKIHLGQQQDMLIVWKPQAITKIKKIEKMTD